MEIPTTLAFVPADHPVPAVARSGLELDDPYIEHCWAMVLGPTPVSLLRRIDWAWKEGGPAQWAPLELSHSLGLSRYNVGCRRLLNTLDRLERVGFAEPGASEGRLRVYRRVPPLTERHLAQAPAHVRRLHGELLDRHIARLLGEPGAPEPVARATQPDPARALARLSRLEAAAPGAHSLPPLAR